MATSAPLLQNDKLPPATAGAAVALELGVLHEGFSPDSRLSKGDQRVSMAPDVAEQLIKDGYGIIVEKGAGIYSGFTDQAFIQKGCKVAERAEVIRKSSVLFSIEPPEADFPACKGKIVISWVGRLLDKGKAVCEKAKSAGVMLIDVTAVPRITIAQKLDVLSSQAKCAGHRAVIEASYAFGRFHTAEMTAAGKYPPSQTFVLGCGVAGLAAIGTSKAMGSVVRAWDVRDVSDQVHSMGAKWVTVDFKESGEGQGGYAKESSDAFKRVQQETFRKVLAEVDIAISTAAIPGRPSPLLITKEAVSGMKPGSVIVDLAAQGGGNCELTKLNEIVTTPNGVTIIGYADMPARMASQASTMYAQNMCNLLRHIHGTGKASDFMKKLLGALDAPGDEGDIVSRSIVCTRDGKAVTMPPPPQPTPVKPKAAAPAEKKVVKEDPLKAAAAGAFVLTFGVCCMLAMGEGVKTSLLTTFLLAGAAGYQAVWGVAHALHTPLMSVTNAISGCTAIGGLLLMEKTSSPFAYLLASLALLVSAVNIFGGFVVSQRMLDLFKKPGDKDYTAMMLFPGLVFLFVSLTRPELLKAVSTVSALLCVAAIGGLATMSTANAGCKFGMVGVFGAMAATMVDMTEGNLVFAAILLAIGGVGGVVMGLKVSPIALPQTVAAFHSLVGLAATCTSIGSFVHHPVPGATMENTSCILGDFIGGITLTGSLIAFGKLNGNLRSSTDSSEEADTTWRSMTARCLGANERFTSQGSLMPRFLIDVLNSVSQVVFVTNSLSGALILLAMLIGAPRGAFLLGFFGALCATGISWLVGLDPDARREGLLGYNAVLVGAGFAVFVQNFLLAALGTLIFGMLSALLAAGLSRLVKPHLTLSFNVCILSGLALVHLMELEHLLPSESHSAEAVFQWISDFPLLDGLQFLKATLNGVSQIFLVTSPVSGVIVLVAICFVTPLGALSTLVGSIVATLGAAACGAEVLEVKKGIWGFNAALTALWVALHFRSQGPIPVLLLVLFASCCATGAFALLATATALSGWARAPFTLPFNAVAFFLVAVERCVLHREMCTKQRPQCTEENLATP